MPDPIADLVTLFQSEAFNYGNIPSYNSGDIYIASILDNPQTTLTKPQILIYTIDHGLRTYRNVRRKRYNKDYVMGIQIYAPTRAGVLEILDEVERVLDVYADWKQVDPTANYNSILVRSSKDLSNKKRNFFKFDLTVTLECLSVVRAS